MTKPIYEPTPDRNVADAKFATEQLFRRPAPRPGVQLTSFRGMLLNDVNGISDGNLDICTFDVWENGDSAVFTEHFDMSGALDGVFGIAGLYTVTFSWDWASSWTGSQSCAIDDNVLVYPDEGWEGTRGSITGISAGDGVVSLTRSYPTLYYEEIGGGNATPEFQFFVGQLSGGPQDVQGRFEIIFWAPIADVRVGVPTTM